MESSFDLSWFDRIISFQQTGKSAARIFESSNAFGLWTVNMDLKNDGNNFHIILCGALFRHSTIMEVIIHVTTIQ